MISNTSADGKISFREVLKSIFTFGKTKTHDFRKFQKDADYYVDFADSYNSAQMITNINVKMGEHIILTDSDQTLKYCAEVVDCYWNDTSLREIKLKRLFLNDTKS